MVHAQSEDARVCVARAHPHHREHRLAAAGCLVCDNVFSRDSSLTLFVQFHQVLSFQISSPLFVVLFVPFCVLFFLPLLFFFFISHHRSHAFWLLPFGFACCCCCPCPCFFLLLLAGLLRAVSTAWLLPPPRRATRDSTPRAARRERKWNPPAIRLRSTILTSIGKWFGQRMCDGPTLTFCSRDVRDRLRPNNKPSTATTLLLTAVHTRSYVGRAFPDRRLQS